MSGGEDEDTAAATSALHPVARELLAAALPDLPEDVRTAPGDPAPIFIAQAISAALFDRSGRVICATPAFEQARAGDLIDREQLATAALEAAPVLGIAEVDSDDGVEAAPFIYASARQAAAWRLPPQLAEAARARPDAVVVLSTHGAALGPPLLVACEAYGLTNLQSRVVVETIRTGKVKEAAERVGVSFHTAREAVSEALRRTRCRRMPQLVSKLTDLAFGVLPQEPSDALADIWGLSARQSAIAGMVATGMSRAETARAIRVGEATVKKELDQVYRLLQVTSSPALARKVVETRALRWLTHVTGGDAGFLHSSSEPLQFAHSPDGRRIAFSDYGPATGRPVLVLHSGTTTRYVSRMLLRSLHQAGYRPISIDRPGFGLTDDLTASDGRDQFHVAAADAATVLDRIKVRAVDVVSRASLALLGLHDYAPDRLDRVVMVNPATPRSLDRHTSGLWGQLKALFGANPAMVSLMLRAYFHQLTLERLSSAFVRWAEGSPADAEAARNPDVVRDYFMSARMLATGRADGAVREVALYSAEAPRDPMPGVGWTVLMAGHDMLYDVDQSLAYWRSVLPDGRFQTIDGAGRLLAMTHPHTVVTALRRA